MVSEVDSGLSKLKKWFMLQMWRFQQIAAVMTLGLLALNLSLQVNSFMNWRGGWFSNPYLGVPFILLVLISVIWCVSVVWDLKMKMWREQAAVMYERNPYSKEKLVSKEVVQMSGFWIPDLRKSGNIEEAEFIRRWLKKELETDPALRSELKDLLSRIGMCPELKSLMEEIQKEEIE